MTKILIDRAVVEQALEALETPIHEQSFMQKQNAITNLRASLAEPQEPVGFKDAPERIWLQACEDDHCEVPFREHDEITWCAEQQNPLDVPYVRADLAAPPQRPAEPVQESQGCDHCEHPLYAGTRETLRLVDELALCAELKREYQEQFAQAAVQRDALLEALKLIDKEFKKHGRHHWPEAVKARAAIKAVEGEKK